MNYLSVETISKRFGERLLFSDVTFGIDKGDKVALVAKNGAGKSTLLKLLCNQDEPDEGRIVYRNGISVAYLDQSDRFSKGATVLSAALNSDIPENQAILEYQRASSGDGDLNHALERMNELNAWDADVKVKEILTQLKLDEFDKPVEHLSGGQKKRLALAKLLATEPDFMILDEPTNHLDLDMIEWLEERLQQSNSTILMVTHDRYFLEVVCDTIIELDRQTTFKYGGNFSTFLGMKEERNQIEVATVSKAKNLYRKELEWMRRMPKARGTKAKARQDAFYKTEEVAKTKLGEDSLELIIKPERLGSKILEFHKVSYQIGDLILLDKFDYIFKRNEKIGIIGPNGVGKSSLLKLVMEEYTPTAGKIVLGETVKIGYYSQDGLNFKDDKRVIEVIKDIAEYIQAEKGRKLSAAQMLEMFLFSKETHWQLVSTLSGGEKKRLYLLTVLMANPNFLILDEPTNDLDIYAMAALEDYLLNFNGCVIVVSHDRFFLDKMADHLFVFMGDGKVKNHPGGYSNFLDWRKKNKHLFTTNKEEKPVGDKSNEGRISGVDLDGKTRKLSYNEQKEYKQLGREIEKLEEKQKSMNAKIASGVIEDPEVFYKELAELADSIDEKSMRWLELSEFV